MEGRTTKSDSSSAEQKNRMTLGEHITSIIMMDYGNGKPPMKNNVLSQINGSPEDSREFWISITFINTCQKCILDNDIIGMIFISYSLVYLQNDKSLHNFNYCYFWSREKKHTSNNLWKKTLDFVIYCFVMYIC